MGRERRKPAYNEKNAQLVPGPGSHDPLNKTFEYDKPRFHMGQVIRHDDVQKFIQSIPGPGHVNPETSPVKSRAPSFSMGQKLPTFDKEHRFRPGPGNYSNNAETLKTSAPKFGFGTSKRPELGKSKD